MAQVVKNHLPMQESGFESRVRKIPWRRKWQTTPVFLPGNSHGQRSLADYSPWGHKSRTWLSDWTATINIFWWWFVPLDIKLDEDSLPWSDSRATLSSLWQVEWKIGIPGPTQEEAWIPRRNSRIPPQLEKNHVFPSSSQYEALAR